MTSAPPWGGDETIRLSARGALLFGVLVDRIEEASLIVSSALSIAALGCLMLVTKTHRSDTSRAFMKAFKEGKYR